MNWKGSKMSKTSEWVKVGTIGVDAGLCWIGDPCYILHKTSEELDKRGLGNSWSDNMGQSKHGLNSFCDKLHPSASGLKNKDEDMQDAKSFGYLGVVVSTGYGDGGYNVYIKHDPSGRVAEVKVVFIGDEEDENSDY